MSGDRIDRDLIDMIPHYKESPLVQKAINDMEKYLADKKNKQTEITEEEEIKRAYATRRLYMASIPAQEAAEYMAKVMDKKMRSMRGVSFAALGKEEFWTELLEAEVDKNGEEIECVERCVN